MKRRTLDVLFSAGGIALAGSPARARTRHDQQRQLRQGLREGPAEPAEHHLHVRDALTAEEQQSACLVKYAGQPLTTGKQAECYANDFIGLHLQSMADGQTYAELGAPQSALRDQVAAAAAANDPALPDLQKQLTAVTAQRDSLFKGETLRGLLLTSFGFSVFGVKGEQVATVAYIVAALLALLSIAGFVHAFKTPKDEAFAAPQPVHVNGKADDKELVGV